MVCIFRRKVMVPKKNYLESRAASSPGVPRWKMRMPEPTAPGRRELYLHVGTRKSGTSFLQKSAYSSLSALAEQGLGVPLTSWEDVHGTLYEPLLGIEEGRPVPASTLHVMRSLRTRLSETPGERLLITFEDLAALAEHRMAPLAEAFEDFQVHVIVTAREFGRQIPSEWQQSVKERLLARFPEYVDDVLSRSGSDAQLFWRRQDVPEILARWRLALPDASMTLLTVPPSSMGRHVLPERFFSLLGVDPSTVSSPERSTLHSAIARQRSSVG